MRKHLPLIAVAIFLALVQVASVYWFSQRDDRVVVDRVERLHADITNGVIYASFVTKDQRPVALGMTPRAALQLQAEMARMITDIQRNAQQVR